MSNLEMLRAEKDEIFRDHHQSPLTREQRSSFTGLKYFPENEDLCLQVKVNLMHDEQTIHMETSTGGVQVYSRYGRFNFMVDGIEAELTIYMGEHGFFLPFVDSLAGTETYPAGRYLEPEQLGGEYFLVDFNLAYNPLCAYNEMWSCPITPFENRLKVPIRAGEKNFQE